MNFFLSMHHWSRIVNELFTFNIIMVVSLFSKLFFHNMRSLDADGYASPQPFAVVQVAYIASVGSDVFAMGDDYLLLCSNWCTY
jgi:hypothetical protein